MNETPIPVLQFSNQQVRGGAEEHILTLLRGLDRRYFRLLLSCPPEMAEQLRGDLPGDVEVLPVSLITPRHPAGFLQLAGILRQRRVQILHSHQFYSSLFAAPMGWLCRVPVIIETPHNRELWRRGLISSHFFVDRIVGRLVTQYIAVSHANAGYLVEQKGLPAAKITVIQNGCNLRRFDPERPVPTTLKQSLGCQPEDPILLLAGRLEEQKGHRFLLAAMPAILHAFPRVHLLCLGQGSLKEELQSLACKLGVERHVQFLGYRPNIAEWLALADLTVLPSLYEGLPLVAVESLAAGCPVVATAVDGTPEVVIDGKTGFTVPPKNPERLAEAICRLLADRELRQRFAEAGRNWVLQHFSEDRQIRQTQDLYLDLYRKATQAHSAAQRIREEATWTAKAH